MARQGRANQREDIYGLGIQWIGEHWCPLVLPYEASLWRRGSLGPESFGRTKVRNPTPVRIGQ